VNASAAGAGSAASGATGAATAGAPRTVATAGALQAALTAEHATIYGYGVAGAHLTGAERAAATSHWVAHQVARDDLEAMLRSMGADPVPAAAAYRLPGPVRTARDAVSLAIMLEDRTATAYLGLVAASAPAVRRLGAVRLRTAALSAAFWRGTTVAFPGLPASVLGRQPKL
jgi:hypothetical protein